MPRLAGAARQGREGTALLDELGRLDQGFLRDGQPEGPGRLRLDDAEEQAGRPNLTRRAPLAEFADLLGELPDADRLRQVTREAGPEQPLAVAGHRLGRERDDRDPGRARLGPQAAEGWCLLSRASIGDNPTGVGAGV